MTKAELIKAIQENMSGDVSKAVADDALKAVLKTITEATIQDEKLSLAGFGTFTLRERAARQGVNPQDPSKKINIPASKSIGFKPAKSLKDLLNNK